MAVERAARSFAPPREAFVVKRQQDERAGVLDGITAEWLWLTVWHAGVQFLNLLFIAAHQSDNGLVDKPLLFHDVKFGCTLFQIFFDRILDIR